ncbi:MAG: 4Fe-4S dicluster domain-containing protein [Prevotella sp.]
MLRKIRIILAVLFFISVTALFLDFTGFVHAYLGWTAKIQFLPALMTMNVGIVVFLTILTLLIGRLYCSVICPLGVMQDIFSWISEQRKRKKYRFQYSKEVKWLRYGMFILFIACMLVGINAIVVLLAPYSSYGRIVSNIFAPIYRWGNNILAFMAERVDSYSFYNTEVYMKNLSTFVIAVFTFIIIGMLSWRKGRIYCNTICPVGTILGFFSRFSLFRPVIDNSKCKNCSLCSHRCKSSCINYKNHSIDYNRCVACMDCIDTCKHGALHLKLRWSKNIEKRTDESIAQSQIDNARRKFLSATALLAITSAVKAQQKKVDGGLAVIEDKQKPQRTTSILPAGSHSAQYFANHCTACQLCVSVCPNDVLIPSTDIKTLMQPEMSYERGYCRPECNRCSEVCPAEAIRPITIAEKSSTRIGHAIWIKKNCIPLTDGVSCGNCARHCPAGAILMVPSDSKDPDSLKIPVINVERCIGCGACEHLCPARPFSAIYVEGHEIHSEY